MGAVFHLNMLPKLLEGNRTDGTLSPTVEADCTKASVRHTGHLPESHQNSLSFGIKELCGGREGSGT